MDSKLSKAKAKHKIGTRIRTKSDVEVFKDDVLKHHIRVDYWLPQIERLARARSINTIRYLTLCAETAFDVRLLRREKLINLLQDQPVSLVYCEKVDKSFQFLQSSLSGGHGFHGAIQQIATDPSHPQFGEFWSTFPLDVINLDFWGDIHEANNTVVNVFTMIQKIIAQQSLLRNPYELWLTWRAKPDRIANNVENAYAELLKNNIKINGKFNKSYQRSYSGVEVTDLDIDDLVRVGFLKWLAFIANKEFSVIDWSSTRLLAYTRPADKDGNPYLLYNYMVRIKPYESLVIPSPASEAATFCNEKYEKGVKNCFKKPVNVDETFAELDKTKVKELEEDLKALTVEYENDKEGTLK